MNCAPHTYQDSYGCNWDCKYQEMILCSVFQHCQVIVKVRNEGRFLLKFRHRATTRCHSDRRWFMKIQFCRIKYALNKLRCIKHIHYELYTGFVPTVSHTLPHRRSPGSSGTSATLSCSAAVEIYLKQFPENIFNFEADEGLTWQFNYRNNIQPPAQISLQVSYYGKHEWNGFWKDQFRLPQELSFQRARHF